MKQTSIVLGTRVIKICKIGWGDDSDGYTNIRTWVQIPSSHIKSGVAVHPCNPSAIGTETGQLLGLAGC